MEMTQEQRQARFNVEAGGEGASLGIGTIIFGVMLTAFGGFGFGLLVMGICFFIDGVREHHRGTKMGGQARIVGCHGPYPAQAASPTNGEYREFQEVSGLVRFGTFFFKAWFAIWAVLVAISIIAH